MTAVDKIDSFCKTHDVKLDERIFSDIEVLSKGIRTAFYQGLLDIPSGSWCVDPNNSIACKNIRSLRLSGSVICSVFGKFLERSSCCFYIEKASACIESQELFKEEIIDENDTRRKQNAFIIDLARKIEKEVLEESMAKNT